MEVSLSTLLVSALTSEDWLLERAAADRLAELDELDEEAGADMALCCPGCMWSCTQCSWSFLTRSKASAYGKQCILMRSMAASRTFCSYDKHKCQPGAFKTPGATSSSTENPLGVHEPSPVGFPSVFRQPDEYCTTW